MKEYEQKKKEEEAKLAAEMAKDPKMKKPPPAKGKPGKDDKPQLDVPKLEVPTIVEYESTLGKPFLIERSFQDIAKKLMTPEAEEEPEEE